MTSAISNHSVQHVHIVGLKRLPVLLSIQMPLSSIWPRPNDKITFEYEMHSTTGPI
jgi:hypothetical protein